MRSLRGAFTQTYRKVSLPHALPVIFAGVKAALAFEVIVRSALGAPRLPRPRVGRPQVHLLARGRGVGRARSASRPATRPRMAAAKTPASTRAQLGTCSRVSGTSSSSRKRNSARNANGASTAPATRSHSGRPSQPVLPASSRVGRGRRAPSPRARGHLPSPSRLQSGLPDHRGPDKPPGESLVASTTHHCSATSLTPWSRFSPGCPTSREIVPTARRAHRPTDAQGPGRGLTALMPQALSPAGVVVTQAQSGPRPRPAGDSEAMVRRISGADDSGEERNHRDPHAPPHPMSAWRSPKQSLGPGSPGPVVGLDALEGGQPDAGAECVAGQRTAARPPV